MAFDIFLALFLILIYLPCYCRSNLLLPRTWETPALDQPARSKPVVSPTVFTSLEELARVVDVSYCVGNTGIRKPFECLSHCAELRGFELIAVSPWILHRCLSPSLA